MKLIRLSICSINSRYGIADYFYSSILYFIIVLNFFLIFQNLAVFPCMRDYGILFIAIFLQIQLIFIRLRYSRLRKNLLNLTEVVSDNIRFIVDVLKKIEK